MKKYPTTFALLGISLLIQFVITAFPQTLQHFAFVPAGGLLGWLGLIPHQVAHANWRHLIGNYTFGLPFMFFLEHKLGRLKMAEFYFICGTAGAALQLLLCGPSSSIGSSGAIMGIMAGACMAFGTSRSEHFLAFLYLAVILLPQIASIPLSSLEGIGFACHVGGILMGVLLSTRVRYFTQAPAPQVQPK